MMPSDLTEWHALKKSLSREAFAKKFPYPFLIRRTPRKGAEGGEGDFGERLGFHTNVVDDQAPPEPAGAVRLTGATIIAVAKKPQNPYPERISVGRTLNCDVVIRDGSVSKLHGHFKPVSASEAQLVDRGSANGTKLNGTPVGDDPVRVVSGDTLIFGSVAVQFLDAKRLWDLL